MNKPYIIILILSLSFFGCEFDITSDIEKPINNEPEYTGTIPDSNDYYFSKEDSPHYITESIITSKEQRFIVEAGAELIISPQVEINCYADILLEGTVTDTVKLRPSTPGTGWGFLKAKNETDKFYISYAKITDGILFSFNTDNQYNHVDFYNTQELTWESANARFWFGKVDIKNCRIFGVNKAEGFLIHDGESPSVTNCYFYKTPDAVEMLNCNNGLIAFNNFENSGDDAIDLNGCTNTMIMDNIIHLITDSGMEIGSENYGRSLNTNLSNNLISNCKKGIWLKESSEVNKYDGYIKSCEYGIDIITPQDSTAVSKAYLKGVLFENNMQDTRVDSRSELTIEN